MSQPNEPSEATSAGDWYDDWALSHCRASGLVAFEQLAAMRGVVLRNWSASAVELATLTERWIARGVTLRFLSELAGKLRTMLLELREEERPFADPLPRPPAAHVCRWCENRGTVTVPIRECVAVDPMPRLIPYAGGRNVQTGRALCDAAGCAPGTEARRRDEARDTKRHMITFAAYCIALDVAPEHLLQLLAQHERARAAELALEPEFYGRGFTMPARLAAA